MGWDILIFLLGAVFGITGFALWMNYEINTSE